MKKTLYCKTCSKKKEDEQIERDDYDRVLSPEGINDAKNMAQQFASKNLPVDLIVSSPALRTKKLLKYLRKH